LHSEKKTRDIFVEHTWAILPPPRISHLAQIYLQITTKDTKQKFQKLICFPLNKENLNETFHHIQVDANDMQLVVELELGCPVQP
jgi:hypothetical protein